MLLKGSQRVVVGEQLAEEGETLAVGVDGRDHLGHFFARQSVLHNLVHSLPGQVGPVLWRVEEPTLDDAILGYGPFQNFLCRQITECLFLRKLKVAIIFRDIRQVHFLNMKVFRREYRSFA